MRKTLALVLLLLFCGAAVAQTTDGKASKLSAKQLKQLRSKKGWKFVLPTYVPKGFRVKSMEIDISSKEHYDHFFSVDYTNGKGGEFTVQMASGGIGDLILDDEGVGKMTTKPIVAGHAKSAEMMFVEKKPTEFGLNWIELDKSYKMPFVSAMGRGLSSAEAVKIVSSLKTLR